MFDENMALFVRSNQGSTYYPNPRSTVQSDYKAMFKFVGRVIAKALCDQNLIDCYFVKAFYKMLLGMPLSYSDIEDFDQELYNSLKWLLENKDVQHIGMYFQETIDYFGTNKEIDLIENGSEILVDDNNKFEYVQRVTHFKLYEAIKT